MSDNDRHDAGLRSAGLKVTGPRIKVLEVLARRNPRHKSAEDIYKALLEDGHEIGLATIYRVLTHFEEAGIVQRLNFDEGHSLYELHDDEHHDHIVCIECGRVEEFVDEVIEARQRSIAKKAGFTVTDHCLYICGICKDCQQGSGTQ